MEVGGWVQAYTEFVFIGKSSQNSHIPVLIFYAYHAYFVCKYAIKSC